MAALQICVGTESFATELFNRCLQQAKDPRMRLSTSTAAIGRIPARPLLGGGTGKAAKETVRGSYRPRRMLGP